MFHTMKNIQTKVVEKINTHILGSIIFFLNRALYKGMWKYNVEPDRPEMTIQRMRIACAIYLRLQVHALKLCNTRCTTMIVRKHFNVTSTFPAFFIIFH